MGSLQINLFRCGHSGLGRALNSVTGVLVRSPGGTQTPAEGEGQVTSGVEMDVMQRPTEEGPGPHAAAPRAPPPLQEARRDSAQEPWEGVWSYHLDLGLLAS